jgi:hypothetical protein
MVYCININKNSQEERSEENYCDRAFVRDGYRFGICPWRSGYGIGS